MIQPSSCLLNINIKVERKYLTSQNLNYQHILVMKNHVINRRNKKNIRWILYYEDELTKGVIDISGKGYKKTFKDYHRAEFM